MNCKGLLDPSSTTGALIIGIIAGLISGIILGFLSGRTYEQQKISKSKINSNGNNVIIQNSEISRK